MAIGKPRGKKGMRPVFVYHGAACDSDVLHTAPEPKDSALRRDWAQTMGSSLGSRLG
jgi:hypothetical protein